MSKKNAFVAQRLILSAGTIPSADFRTRVRVARAAGFDAISLFPQQYLAAISKEKLSLKDMQLLLADRGMSVDEVDPLLDWFDTKPSTSEELLVRIAEGFGARSINAPVAFASNRSFDCLVDRFGELCERMRAYNLRVDLEFLPWTSLPDLKSAIKLVQAVNQDNAGIMLDFWHFMNSGAHPSELLTLTPAQATLITSVQINDGNSVAEEMDLRQKWRYAKFVLSGLTDNVRVLGRKAFFETALKAKYPHPNAQKMMQEAQCSRLFPSEGDFPIAEMLQNLAKIGAQPATGIEVFNLSSSASTPEHLASKAIQSYQAALTYSS